MKYTGVIYVYTNNINGKRYIGQTTNEANRKKFHKNVCLDTLFSRAIRKYGWENFKYNVLVNCEANTKEELSKLLNFWEKHFIEYYDSYNSGYNMTLGGDGIVGAKRSDETKQKLSKDWSKHHKPPTDEVKKQISNTLKEKYKNGSISVVNKKAVCLYYLNGDFYKEYSDTVECAKDLGLKSSTSITNQIKGRTKTIKKLFIAKFKSNG